MKHDNRHSEDAQPCVPPAQLPNILYRLKTGQWIPGALSAGVKHGRGVMLTTHSLVEPRLRNSRSYISSHPKREFESRSRILSVFRRTYYDRAPSTLLSERLNELGNFTTQKNGREESIKRKFRSVPLPLACKNSPLTFKNFHIQLNPVTV
jgi:hypothetical protein